ncbi:DUF58 domain-containing protein [bacterium]|nr:DUF58 domain-containing protein [candidate division CSSED10-310 bacterium]
MIDKELLKKIRRIEIYTNRMVNDVLGGKYHSVFKGRGMEFDEVREYLPGDDIRSIDWNVTARMGHPFIKKYVEERQLTVMLLADASSSGLFGTHRQLKGEILAEICALLAFSAIKNHDRVGLILFTDKVEKYLPPQQGSEHVLRVIRELLYFQPKATRTDVNQALDYLNQVQSRKSVAFLVSDFLAGDFERSLRITSRRHDLIAISVTDPREISMPAVGLLELEDAETGEVVIIDTYDTAVRDAFTGRSAAFRKERDDLFKTSGVDHVEIVTDRGYVKPLVMFFKERAGRLRM